MKAGEFHQIWIHLKLEDIF